MWVCLLNYDRRLLELKRKIKTIEIQKLCVVIYFISLCIRVKLNSIRAFDLLNISNKKTAGYEKDNDLIINFPPPCIPVRPGFPNGRFSY